MWKILKYLLIGCTSKKKIMWQDIFYNSTQILQWRKICVSWFILKKDFNIPHSCQTLFFSLFCSSLLTNDLCLIFLPKAKKIMSPIFKNIIFNHSKFWSFFSFLSKKYTTKIGKDNKTVIGMCHFINRHLLSEINCHWMWIILF